MPLPPPHLAFLYTLPSFNLPFLCPSPPLCFIPLSFKPFYSLLRSSSLLKIQNEFLICYTRSRDRIESSRTATDWTWWWDCFVSRSKLSYCLPRHRKLNMHQCCCGVHLRGASFRCCHATPSPLPRWPSPPTHNCYWLFPVIAPGLYGDATCPSMIVQVRFKGFYYSAFLICLKVHSGWRWD